MLRLSLLLPLLLSLSLTFLPTPSLSTLPFSSSSSLSDSEFLVAGVDESLINAGEEIVLKAREESLNTSPFIERRREEVNQEKEEIEWGKGVDIPLQSKDTDTDSSSHSSSSHSLLETDTFSSSLSTTDQSSSDSDAELNTAIHNSGTIMDLLDAPEFTPSSHAETTLVEADSTNNHNDLIEEDGSVALVERNRRVNRGKSKLQVIVEGTDPPPVTSPFTSDPSTTGNAPSSSSSSPSPSSISPNPAASIVGEAASISSKMEELKGTIAQLQQQLVNNQKQINADNNNSNTSNNNNNNNNSATGTNNSNTSTDTNTGTGINSSTDSPFTSTSRRNSRLEEAEITSTYKPQVVEDGGHSRSAYQRSSVTYLPRVDAEEIKGKETTILSSCTSTIHCSSSSSTAPSTSTTTTTRTIATNTFSPAIVQSPTLASTPTVTIDSSSSLSPTGFTAAQQSAKETLEQIANKRKELVTQLQTLEEARNLITKELKLARVELKDEEEEEEEDEEEGEQVGLVDGRRRRGSKGRGGRNWRRKHNKKERKAKGRKTNQDVEAEAKQHADAIIRRIKSAILQALPDSIDELVNNKPATTSTPSSTSTFTTPLPAVSKPTTAASNSTALSSPATSASLTDKTDKNETKIAESLSEIKKEEAATESKSDSIATSSSNSNSTIDSSSSTNSTSSPKFRSRSQVDSGSESDSDPEAAAARFNSLLSSAAEQAHNALNIVDSSEINALSYLGEKALETNKQFLESHHQHQQELHFKQKKVQKQSAGLLKAVEEAEKLNLNEQQQNSAKKRAEEIEKEAERGAARDTGLIEMTDEEVQQLIQ